MLDEGEGDRRRDERMRERESKKRTDEGDELDWIIDDDEIT